MKKLFLAAGVAALAIAVPAGAKPGGGKGGGNGGGQAAQSHGGGGHGGGRHGGGGMGGGGHGGGSPKFLNQGGGPKFEARGGGKHFQPHGGGQQRMEKRGGGERRFARAEHPGKAERKAFRMDRPERAQHKANRIERQAMRGGGSNGFEHRKVRPNQTRLAAFETRDRDFRRMRDDREIRQRNLNEGDRWDYAGSYGAACPPGLAKKNNGCLPPGQAKKLIGSAIPVAYASGYLPDALRDLYRDDDDYYYRYGDGYLYRVDRDSNLVNSLLPLFGGGYTVGQQFPYGYADQDYYVPSYYQSFYQETPDDYYRYDNGYVYDIDRRSGLIENIIPAYGYGYGVGEMLPASYSAYNLPYQYRDVYQDTGDYYYRYAPGAIYQVDRDSSLITSVASLLSGGGMGVGQRLPAGYSAYNVPYDYRDEYYDTPDNMYRYADGNIYQVDPTTQLITAVISALV